MRKLALAIVILGLPATGIQAQMLATISDPVETEFATYEPVAVSFTPSVPSYNVPPDLSGVAYVDDYWDLTKEAKAQLAENHFVVRPSDFKQIYDIYNFAKKRNLPQFVSTDAMLHVFHVLFDYSLRVLEMKRFYPGAAALTDSMLDRFYHDYVLAASDPDVADAAGRTMAYFGAARKLLRPRQPLPWDLLGRPLTPHEMLADEELALVDAADRIEYSPIFDYREDYTQYIPRGHYTRNDTLRQYFRGLMWYGRMMFRVRPDTTAEAIQAGRQATRMALLICKAMSNMIVDGRPALEVWDEIYQPTVFYVGKADDLSLSDYLPLIEEVYGKPAEALTFDDLADTETLDLFIDQALDLRDPLINSSVIGQWEEFQAATKAFRFMGQRFIPDSYMLWELVHANVWGRLMPSGLDVFSILGCERAAWISDRFYSQPQMFPEYQPKIDQLRSEFGQLDPAAWAQNLYWNWLYTLMPLLFPKGEGYPEFMKREAWQDKELNTALGSWAELRHDTILYAKQSYSQETSVPPPASFREGYVEPNPHLYARLAALARFMNMGLSARGLLLSEFQEKLELLESLSLQLKVISEKELELLPLTDDEYATIFNFGDSLEALMTFAPETSEQILSDTDDAMAVIADVHTDPNSGTVLEEGVGYPFWIYVIVPVNGRMVLTAGVAFSYYEFTHPMADRLTDEAWQEMQASTDPKLPPVWTHSYLDTAANFVKRYYVNEYVDPTGVDEPDPDSPAAGFGLVQSYPNPLNLADGGGTMITYRVPAPADVSLAVYNLLGQEVARLVDRERAGGTYSARWDGRDAVGRLLPPGIYFYRLTMGKRVQVRRLVLVR